jgi:hypothetical protein
MQRRSSRVKTRTDEFVAVDAAAEGVPLALGEELQRVRARPVLVLQTWKVCQSQERERDKRRDMNRQTQQGSNEKCATQAAKTRNAAEGRFTEVVLSVEPQRYSPASGPG